MQFLISWTGTEENLKKCLPLPRKELVCAAPGALTAYRRLTAFQFRTPSVRGPEQTALGCLRGPTLSPYLNKREDEAVEREFKQSPEVGALRRCPLDHTTSSPSCFPDPAFGSGTPHCLRSSSLLVSRKARQAQNTSSLLQWVARRMRSACACI